MKCCLRQRHFKCGYQRNRTTDGRMLTRLTFTVRFFVNNQNSRLKKSEWNFLPPDLRIYRLRVDYYGRQYGILQYYRPPVRVFNPSPNLYSEITIFYILLEATLHFIALYIFIRIQSMLSTM